MRATQQRAETNDNAPDLTLRYGEAVTTKLDASLKREIAVLGKPYTLTITREGLNLVPKGRRKGYALAWADLVSGDAALAAALNASLAHAPRLEPAETTPGPHKGKAGKAQKPRRRQP